MEQAKSDMQSTLQNIISEGSFDYLDFGCSKGGSLKLGKDLFGGTNGLGIDIDPTKVAATRALGFEAVLADATNLGIVPGSVSFVLLLHFIEHLSGYDMAKRAIASACHTARNFVYIRHPWFDSDGQLMDMNLKFYWSDWSGHPNHFGRIQFHNALRANKRIYRWWLFGCDPVPDTQVRDLIDLNGPTNAQGASPEEVASREKITFSFPVYKQIACFIQINPSLKAEDIIAKFRSHEVIYDSGVREG